VNEENECETENLKKCIYIKGDIIYKHDFGLFLGAAENNRAVWPNLGVAGSVVVVW